MNIEVMKNELYLLLGLVCSDCNDEYYPQEDGWNIPNATEADVKEMVQKYLPRAISLGWSVDIRDNILCPKCSKGL